MKAVDAATIQFRLAEPIGNSVFKGTVYVNGINLRHTMLRDGWYKFDYKNDRDVYDIMLQKEAECMRKGIWAHKNYTVTDERCQ
jgi:endonuclease YncB( thermonuclease family)